MPPLERLIEELVTLGARVRDGLLGTVGTDAEPAPSAVRSPEAGDVAYAIDLDAEQIVSHYIDEARDLHPLVLVTEEGGTRCVPPGADPGSAAWRVIVDPIDGTREVAYDKRSAWFLAGVAPNRGPGTTLRDIVGAVQLEIPPTHQALAAVLTASAGGGVQQRLWDRRTGTHVEMSRALRPSTATTIRHGFAVFTDFFAGSHHLIGRVADAVFRASLGDVQPGEAAVFNDQYISTGGQMYLLASGRYRFVADIRPLIDRALGGRAGRTVGLCAHPYDLSTHLLATAAGAVVTDCSGGPLAYPLDATTPCGWIGYANESIRQEVEPALLDILHQLDTLAMKGNPDDLSLR
jgi:hypothetical protein